jgi:hypothetical protein
MFSGINGCNPAIADNYQFLIINYQFIKSGG